MQVTVNLVVGHVALRQETAVVTPPNNNTSSSATVCHANYERMSYMHISSLEPQVSPESEIKTCPCCEATLFADMDICYGCLYDFSSEKVSQSQRRLEEAPEGISKGALEDASAEEVPVEVYDPVSFESKEDCELQADESQAPSQSSKLMIQTKAGTFMLCCTPQGIALLDMHSSIASKTGIQLSPGTKVSWGGVSFLIS